MSQPELTWHDDSTYGPLTPPRFGDPKIRTVLFLGGGELLVKVRSGLPPTFTEPIGGNLAWLYYLLFPNPTQVCCSQKTHSALLGGGKAKSRYEVSQHQCFYCQPELTWHGDSTYGPLTPPRFGDPKTCTVLYLGGGGKVRSGLAPMVSEPTGGNLAWLYCLLFPNPTQVCCCQKRHSAILGGGTQSQGTK